SSCNGAISLEFLNLSTTDLITPAAIWQGAAAKAWTTLFTGVLEAAMRVCRTPQERLFFQQTILDRLIAYPPFRDSTEVTSTEKLVAECLERLKYEGNTHLLEVKEFPSILEELQCRVD